jgi:hypothetical protein
MVVLGREGEQASAAEFEAERRDLARRDTDAIGGDEASGALDRGWPTRRWGLVVKDHRWRVPGAVWEKMEPLLAGRPHHPLGCQRPRIPDRYAINAILFGSAQAASETRSTPARGCLANHQRGRTLRRSASREF